MKHRVNGQRWVSVWTRCCGARLVFQTPGLFSPEAGSSSWSGVCTRVWLWCCMWTHASLIRLQGADNKPSKSSKWVHKCWLTLDTKTKTGLAADSGLLLQPVLLFLGFYFLFIFFSPLIFLLFSFLYGLLVVCKVRISGRLPCAFAPDECSMLWKAFHIIKTNL